MKLYSTTTSAYGKLVRVVLHEKGLAAAVPLEVVKTRVPDCVLHPMNPTGKVPTLETDDGVYLSEARMICTYLDTQVPVPRVVDPAPGPAAAQLEGVMTGAVDGVAVWVRELYRVEDDRSEWILGQELARAERCTAWLAGRLDEIALASRFTQLQLLFMLQWLDETLAQPWWRERHPSLVEWYDAARAAPSVRAL